jgi:protein-disulfide isomerase
MTALLALATTACTREDHSANRNSRSFPLKPAVKPANGDWTQAVSATPEGGFLMGNPAAPVHLVEFGSLTCPHCKAFNDEGAPALLADYVKPGKVAYEFRNYVRDPYDIAAALIVRCDGAKSFFPLAETLYKDQPGWIAKVEALSSKEDDQLDSLPEEQQFLARARVAGLDQWGAAHGIPTDRIAHCLTDRTEIERLVQMNSDAGDEYDISGTPTFLINGKEADASTWQGLKPALDAALVHGG